MSGRNAERATGRGKEGPRETKGGMRSRDGKLEVTPF